MTVLKYVICKRPYLSVSPDKKERYIIHFKTAGGAAIILSININSLAVSLYTASPLPPLFKT